MYAYCISLKCTNLCITICTCTAPDINKTSTKKGQNIVVEQMNFHNRAFWQGTCLVKYSFSLFFIAPIDFIICGAQDDCLRFAAKKGAFPQNT